ncbi:MAG: imidazole glycerol phosphate synthase subunit HisH [Alphaproteobacteria bacterium]|nr:imidazole glycerol phosphate synthase subunit HisH [Alphaproteobacteria bacterium]
MAKETVVIIDYGSGNLRSAAKAFERIGNTDGRETSVVVSNKPEDLLSASRIVLPGQGAFGDCMNGLTAIEGMREALYETVRQKAVPFLGICVGMQLLATRGLEHGAHAGLNWIEGEVLPLQADDPNLKIPHMGWNDLAFPSASVQQDNRHFVLRNISSSDNFYFVHSFVFQCKHTHHVLALTDYGSFQTAIVGKDNMIGVQFHPEKSQNAGLRLIGNFLDWKP